MDLVDCFIARLVLDERHDRQTVTLAARDGEASLSMGIGQHEALAIERGLQEEAFPRPLTHDLLLGCIQSHQSRILDVRILREDGGTYYAELHIERADGNRILLDCRPSDGLALVARQPTTPLLVARGLLSNDSEDAGG